MKRHGWNSEPQNIEQEISNDEVLIRFRLGLRLRSDRLLSLYLKIKMTEYLTSIFIISCSVFDIYPPLEDAFFKSFFFDLTLRPRPEANANRRLF